MQHFYRSYERFYIWHCAYLQLWIDNLCPVVTWTESEIACLDLVLEVIDCLWPIGQASCHDNNSVTITNDDYSVWQSTYLLILIIHVKTNLYWPSLLNYWLDEKFCYRASMQDPTSSSVDCTFPIIRNYFLRYLPLT